MPFVRKGRCVYKRESDGSLKKKGCSETESGAKDYQKKLYSVSEDEETESFEEYFERKNNN